MYTADEKRYDTMRYNRCGRSGLKLPVVSLGLWHNFGDFSSYDNMKQMCFTAFDHGITHFDLANNYGPEYGSAEKHFGLILKEHLSAYRDELIISSKAGYDMWKGPYGNWGSRKYLIASLDQSLKRMGLDYVDIFYHHRMDPETPLEETMGALDQIVKSGKALYVGLSNYDGETMKRACEILTDLKCPFIINQNSYNIFNRTIEQNGLKKAARECQKGIISFSPLAQGMLTDRYLNGIPDDSRIKTDGRFLNQEKLTPHIGQIKKLNDIAAKRGETLAQMALKWVVKDDDVTSVLVGASKPQQILENLKVMEGTGFSEEELKMIDENVVEFLSSIFDAMKMEVEILVAVNEEEHIIEVELKGDDMGILIGKRGQTLDSLQYLTNLAINKHSDEYYKVKIDTEDYRKRRKETLENLAKNIAYKVKRTKRPVSLEPMNPFERRIIHSALQNDRYVTTHSEGDEPYRHVVVTLKK